MENTNENAAVAPQGVAAQSATKVCRECGRELPLSSFKKTRYGVHVGVCTECVNARRKATYRRKAKAERDIYSGASYAKGVASGAQSRGARLERNPLLKDFKPRELIDELRARGYEGTLRFVQEINL